MRKSDSLRFVILGIFAIIFCSSFASSFYSSLENGSLQAHWNFSSSSATGIYDSSENGYFATFKNGLGISDISSGGPIGDYLAFDGVNDYLDFTRIDTTIFPAWSTSVWVKYYDNAEASASIFGGFSSYIETSTNKVKSATTGTTVSSTSALTEGTWTNIILVCDNATDTLTFYINGVNDSSHSYNCTYAPNTGRIRFLGTYYTSSYYFNGSMDEARIYNRTLNESEISQLYNFGRRLISNSTIYTSSYNFQVQPDISFNYTSCNLNLYNGNGFLGMDSVEGGDYFRVFNYTSNLSFGTYTYGVNCTNSSGGVYEENFTIYNYPSELENYSFVNSHGLRIYYDVYYSPSLGENPPIYVISDTWSADRTSMRSEAQAWRDRGYFVLNLETRGKGESEGTKDASAWECLDIYEAVENATGNWGSFLNLSRIYLNGLSGAGGKTLNCIGKMPDYFTAVQGVAGTSNYTLWSELNPAFSSGINTRIGATFAEDPEAYKSRNGAWTAYNVVFPILLHHNDGDASVNATLSQRYNETVNSYRNTNVTYIEEVGSTHDFTASSRAQAVIWFNSFNDSVSLPSSGDLRIGTFLRTKLFDVDLDNGKTGLVLYNFTSNSSFELNLSTDSFSGPVNVTVKNFLNTSRFVLKDNGVEFAVISNGVVSSQTSSYNVSVGGENISFIVPIMSAHIISGEYALASLVSTTSSTTTTSTDSSSGSSIPTSTLENGYKRIFNSGQSASLNIGSSTYVAKVTSVSTESVSVQVEGSSVDVSVGTSEKVDLDSDGVYDLEITVNSVDSSGNANLEFKAISEAVPSESQEEVSEEAKGEEEKPLAEKTSSWYYYVFGAVALIIVLGIVFEKLFRKKKKSKKAKK